MAAILCLLISVAAALLGVAAARRGWWTHATITGVCALLALYTSLLTTTSTTEAPVWAPDTITFEEVHP